MRKSDTYFYIPCCFPANINSDQIKKQKCPHSLLATRTRDTHEHARVRAHSGGYIKCRDLLDFYEGLQRLV